MRAADIRSRFLEFFRERGHEVVPSSSVVPHDDPTLLFANAGMNQFKKVFVGEETRDPPRAASSQKCIRAGGKHNDLDNVGYTARHLTFFEMLGNFSFGDYFKKDACHWAWELITETFAMDSERLWISVFHEDEEAREVWRDHVGVPAQRIVGLGEKDNFWAMGDVGPCGPCSEIHVDLGADKACGADCALGKCECDRWLEIWNLVFMQFDQRADGTRVNLPKPSIDTGTGLERIATVLQDQPSVFETDLLRGIIDEIARVTGAAYDRGPAGTPHRVIADHVRSLSFAIADNAFPDKDGAGYVLRRILRRAARYGYKLGVTQPFIHEVVPHLVREMGDAYPQLREQEAVIRKLIHKEEEQFGRTLKQGMNRFDDELAGMRTADSETFPSTAAFFLHDTCGFPIDLTEQMCREQQLNVDRGGFDALMEEQRKKSRKTVGAQAEGASNAGAGIASDVPATEFFGFHQFSGQGQILRCVGDDPQQLSVILDRTPFYAEGGGQVGDTGVISGPDFSLRVTDTRKQGGVFVHTVGLETGELAAIEGAIADGQSVDTRVDAARRLDIQRNHTATHLMHAALREVLGTHVQQKGSLVAPGRLRFDLSHFDKITREELDRVELRVSEEILRNSQVLEGEFDKDEALARGAMAFFGDKYGDRVRVVEIPGFSIELCGGAHCRATGEIGSFALLAEGSASSGVRRVEAVTGFGAVERGRAAEELLRSLQSQLRTGREDLAERVETLLAEMRDLKSGKGVGGERRDLLEELNAGAGERDQVNGAEVIAVSWEDAPEEEMLRVSDSLKQRPGKRVYILTSTSEGGVRLLVGSSKELPRGAVHCGNIARAGAKILGGGGGGRPDLAQAGGKDVGKLPEAIARMRELVAGCLAQG